MYFSGITEKLKFSNYKYKIVNEIEDNFLSKGYLYLEANPFEDYDQLVFEQGSDPCRVVKLIDPKGKVKILSSDITSGLIEELKKQWEDDIKIKVFYNDRVYKVQKGDIRIFEKLGVESFGTKSATDDLEILLLANDILDRYSGYHLIEVGMSSLVYYMIEECKLDKDEEKSLINSIASKDLYSICEVVKNVDDERTRLFFENIFDFSGDLDDIQIELKDYNIPDKFMVSLKTLRDNFQKIVDLGIRRHFVFDISLIPDFNYYSAFSFRGYIEDYNGEIIKGGRYIINSKEGAEIPGVGFSIEVGELMNYLGGTFNDY